MSESAVKARRILVVDDDKYVREFYSCILRMQGFVTVTAQNGAEGLALLTDEREHFDLVVVDLLMPVKSGWDVIEAIRQEPRLATMPLVAMTGLPLSIEEYERVKVSCDAVFLKSDFELAKFTATLTDLLG